MDVREFGKPIDLSIGDYRRDGSGGDKMRIGTYTCGDDGSTTLIFAIGSRICAVGKGRWTDYQMGSVRIRPPPAVAVDLELPGIHVSFRPDQCSPGTAPQTPSRGSTRVECTDPEHGNSLKVDVVLSGCSLIDE
jgi:hypothetical protein